MLKYTETEVTFAELPDEVSLCINLSNCPCKCVGCHSPHLSEDIGEHLTQDVLSQIIKDNDGITAICFMGGDIAPYEIGELAEYVKKNHPNIKVGWYSGQEAIGIFTNLYNYDYLKLGPYRAECGPLNSPTTNQRLYKVTEGKLSDITYRLQS